MSSQPIKTNADYKAALAEVDGLMSAELGTPEGDKLDVLVCSSLRHTNFA
jgi:HTH-type transcriptional regulator/antitoxin HigA